MNRPEFTLRNFAVTPLLLLIRVPLILLARGLMWSGDKIELGASLIPAWKERR